jgi:ectoine hydroxylase-related dioxygenase (phytanoyl-CoA dioxygenase family)
MLQVKTYFVEITLIISPQILILSFKTFVTHYEKHSKDSESISEQKLEVKHDTSHHKTNVHESSDVILAITIWHKRCENHKLKRKLYN